RSILRRGFTRFLNSVYFVMTNFEDRVEAGDLKQPLKALVWIQKGHMAASTADRGPYGYDLAEAGTIDIIHTCKIENKIVRALIQYAVHKFSQRQVENPQSSAEVQNDDIRNIALLDNQSHG